MRSSSRAAFGVLSLVASMAPFACGGSSSPSTGGGSGGAGMPPDPGITPGGTLPTPAGHDANPYGVAYPSANIGYAQRKGSIAGNVIKNYKFVGYPNADPTTPTATGTLDTIALADFFDPQQKKYKIVHVVVSAVWCVPCNQETDALVPIVAGLAQKGVVFLQLLDDGPTPGTGAKQGDLDGWITRHHTTFSEALDPGNENLGQFFDAAAIPWNANLDARTMEILSSGVGYSGDIPGDVQPWLDWVAKNPPSYQ